MKQSPRIGIGLGDMGDIGIGESVSKGKHGGYFTGNNSRIGHRHKPSYKLFCHELTFSLGTFIKKTKSIGAKIIPLCA